MLHGGCFVSWFQNSHQNILYTFRICVEFSLMSNKHLCLLEVMFTYHRFPKANYFRNLEETYYYFMDYVFFFFFTVMLLINIPSHKMVKVKVFFKGFFIQ